MSDILVGIFDPEVVKYAVLLEFGDDGRDFLRVAYDSHLPAITEKVEEQYTLVLMKKQKINNARKTIGEFVVKLIKTEIEAKGLIKTGRMLNSVEYKVV